MMETKSKNDQTDAPEADNAKKSGRPYVLPYMQNRELSWLAFNKRVLDQGEDHNVPLLERLTFVSIFSSNLQEFFMVRVGSLTDLSLVNKELRDNKTQMTPDEQLRAISLQNSPNAAFVNSRKTNWIRSRKHTYTNI